MIYTQQKSEANLPLLLCCGVHDKAKAKKFSVKVITIFSQICERWQADKLERRFEPTYRDFVADGGWQCPSSSIVFGHMNHSTILNIAIFSHSDFVHITWVTSSVMHSTNDYLVVTMLGSQMWSPQNVGNVWPDLHGIEDLVNPQTSRPDCRSECSLRLRLKPFNSSPIP